MVEHAEQQHLCEDIKELAEYAYVNITETDAIQDGLAKVAAHAEAIANARYRAYGRWASQSSHNRGRLIMIQAYKHIKTLMLMMRN